MVFFGCANSFRDGAGRYGSLSPDVSPAIFGVLVSLLRWTTCHVQILCSFAFVLSLGDEKVVL